MLPGMEWLTEPPCTELAVEKEDPTRGYLLLSGPRGAARAKGGLLAAMGTAFAVGAVAFLRMPFPRMWKIIPALMAASGGGMAAVGVTTAISDVRIEVERGKGIRWTWRARPLQERSLLVKPDEIATFDVKTNVTRSSDELSSGFASFRETAQTTFQLMVVTRDGKAYPVEEFPLAAQAELRRDQIQRALGKKKAAKARAKPKPKGKRTPSRP